MVKIWSAYDPVLKNNSASTNEGGRAPDVLNLYDSTLGIVLSHELVGAKTNEISHCLSIIKGMNLYNCIVTCDALNTQKSFCAAIRAAGGDYCLAVKGNHDPEEQDIRATFSAEPNNSTDLKVFEGDYELGHGRIEHRLVRLLPARRMSSNLRKLWPGLEDGSGCIVEATTYSEPKRNANRDSNNLLMSGPVETTKKKEKEDEETKQRRLFVDVCESYVA